MIGSELALTKSLIDIYAMNDAYDEANFLRPLVDLMVTLDEEEANLFGRSYGQAMSILRADRSRWRQAADIAVRLDIYEVAGAMLDQFKEGGDPHQLADILTICQNPGVPEEVLSSARVAVGNIQLTALRRYNTIRLSPDVEPSTDLEAALAVQSWPGKFDADALSRVAPLVYVAEADAPLNEVLAVCAHIASAGARVRRVPARWAHQPPRPWFTDAYPTVTWSGVAMSAIRANLPGIEMKSVLAPSDWASQLAVPRLLVNLQQSMPRGVNLRSQPIWNHEETPALAPSTLTLGAFDVHEMAFLGAATRGVVSRISKEGLTPMNADVQRWSFDQLVTLRMLQAFKVRTGRPFRGEATRILRQLSEMAHANETSRVGVDSNGNIIGEQGGSFVDLRTRQEVFGEVLWMDDAFKPFTLGGGMVPDLLRPAPTTTVHPATLAGTPIVAGRRISARAIAAMASATRPDVVRTAYPELTGAEVADAVRVGRRINSAA